MASFARWLNVQNKSANTVTIYTSAASQLFRRRGAPHEQTILGVHEGPLAPMVIFDGEVRPGPPDRYVFVVPSDVDSRTPVTSSPPPWRRWRGQSPRATGSSRGTSDSLCGRGCVGTTARRGRPVPHLWPGTAVTLADMEYAAETLVRMSRPGSSRRRTG
jgi:hypothetical protein